MFLHKLKAFEVPKLVVLTDWVYIVAWHSDGLGLLLLPYKYSNSIMVCEGETMDEKQQIFCWFKKY